MSGEKPEEPDDLDRPPAFFPYDSNDEAETEAIEPGEPVEVRVEAVFSAQNNQQIQRFVMLSDGRRKLPIVIGGFEATAIAYPLEGQQPDRPMTHDLFKNVLDRFGVGVKRIMIDDLWGSTYYAKIVFEVGSEEITLDSRPSDAIALAMRMNAPIFVSEGILSQNGP